MTRFKLSTTVSKDTYAFLKQMVESGEAATFADALDKAIDKLRRLENRNRLANATIRYFEQLGATTAAQENALAQDMMCSTGTINFNKKD